MNNTLSETTALIAELRNVIAMVGPNDAIVKVIEMLSRNVAEQAAKRAGVDADSDEKKLRTLRSIYPPAKNDTIEFLLRVIENRERTIEFLHNVQSPRRVAR